ncbi:DUF4401 domain-containing protein [Psychrobacter sp. FME5]|uniref:DUF4401 domain-containing protein n=1 Tax=Psychrobacter sp. FME5 TaxID=2487706 RepID=UPI001787AB22|nr:DUF4401 domain-containing protein [Psychrobacter sp. FME5]MBE0446314.1 DUF4401 domain-containing protein [Psychrobacter sp. FME5]
MTQPRRTIEQLLHQGILPLKNTEAAATHLEVYPSKRTWLTFFDKALLIIGPIALVLSLVFFIAYNWVNMGKMGKFALVEGALVITIALYVVLSFRQKFQLIRQLLLLIASVITGSLLALFGQVYQTGADTWQLFFGWAVLILPWVLIARFPALWLLWLGLINAGLMLYLDLIDLSFINHIYQNVAQVWLLALINFIAFNTWLISTEKQTLQAATTHTNLTSIIPPKTKRQTKSSLHWSTYIVGLLSTCFITYLAVFPVFEGGNRLATLISVISWLGWCGFMLWQFYQRRIDLLMLTYLSFSIITVVMFWIGEWLLDDFDAGGLLTLALLLIAMSSAAVMWLRKVARLNHENSVPSTVARGDIDHKHPDTTLLQLQQLGLVDANAIDNDAQTDQTVNNNPQDHNPWFIQVFFGFSGILASLFFIGFLTLLLENTGVLDSAIANFVMGMVLNIAGFILFKNKHLRRSIFLNSLAFTISVAGQVYVAYALISGDIEHPFAIWLFLLFQSSMTFIVPNFIYRILSSLVALGCVVYLLNYYHLPEISLGLLALTVVISNLQRYRLLQSVSIDWQATIFDPIKAIGYASTLMLLCVSVYFIAAEYGNSFDSYSTAFSYNYYLAQGLLIIASLYGAALILKRYQVSFLSAAGIIVGCTIAILGVMSIYVSGLLATSLIIIIAVANSQRLLLGFGIVALVSYIFWYYYQLDTSLLVKSVSMLVISIALLLMRWTLIKGYLANIKSSANDHQERLS